MKNNGVNHQKRFDGINTYSDIEEALKEELNYRIEYISLIDKNVEEFKKLSLEDQDKLFNEYVDEVLNNPELRKKVEDYFSE